MSYLVLARKYRPQRFAEMIGQAHVTQTLTNAISAGRVAHAILFAGPRGTGKTTVARILAKAMNCDRGPAPEPCNQCRSCREITAGSAVDVFEIDGASNNGVDHVRDLRENAKYKPAHSRYKIYIIDEVHMLSTQAFNALLKTLEEPPAHVMFLFATTEPHKIPITILSRCQRHDFRRIGLGEISDHMGDLCRREGVAVDDGSLTLIAREAGGSMRDALSLLDQMIACTAGEVTEAQVLEILGAVDRKVIFDLSAHVLANDVSAVLDVIDDVYTCGYPIKEFYAELLEHFRNLLIVKMGQRVDKLVDLPAHEITRMQAQVASVSAPFLTTAFEVLFKAESAVKLSEQPRVALELAFLRMLSVEPTLPIEFLIEKLDDLQKTMQGLPAEGGTPAPAVEARSPEAEAAAPPVSARAARSEDGYRFSAGDSPDLIWENLVDTVSRKHPSLAPHLQVSSLRKLRQDGLEIEVNGNSFNSSMLCRKKNLDNLKRVLADVFGRPMALEIVSQNKPAGSIREQIDRENDLRQAALNHPLVQDVVEIFNGQVTQVTVLEPQEKDRPDSGPAAGAAGKPDGVVVPFRR
jgi:DNA polymerase-3 subunit gamma/tau